MPAAEPEWEYEYHETETVDVYVNVELATYVNRGSRADAQVQTVIGGLKDDQNLSTGQGDVANGAGTINKRLNAGTGNPPKKKRKRRARRRAVEPEIQSEESGNDDQPGQEQLQDEEDDLNAQLSGQDLAPEPVDVQISGIESDNPILKFNGDFYSCHWAQELGTNMYFTKSSGDSSNGTDPSPTFPRTLHNHDLLGIGAIKLFAVPAELRPKSRMPSGPTPHELHLSVPEDAPPRRKRQAHFLEQLMMVKAARGDGDRLVQKNGLKGLPPRYKPLGKERGAEAGDAEGNESAVVDRAASDNEA